MDSMLVIIRVTFDTRFSYDLIFSTSWNILSCSVWLAVIRKWRLCIVNSYTYNNICIHYAQYISARTYYDYCVHGGRDRWNDYGLNPEWPRSDFQRCTYNHIIIIIIILWRWWENTFFYSSRSDSIFGRFEEYWPDPVWTHPCGCGSAAAGGGWRWRHGCYWNPSIVCTVWQCVNGAFPLRPTATVGKAHDPNGIKRGTRSGGRRTASSIALATVVDRILLVPSLSARRLAVVVYTHRSPRHDTISSCSLSFASRARTSGVPRYLQQTGNRVGTDEARRGWRITSCSSASSSPRIRGAGAAPNSGNSESSIQVTLSSYR